MPDLLLASSSPRRAELLAQMGLSFEVVDAEVNEDVVAGESPAAYVARLAQAKARAGYRPNSVALGGDTAVVINDEILGKPRGPKDGVAMLRKLSASVHTVFTAIAVYDGERCETSVVDTAVEFRKIEENEAQAYWRTGELHDKAGGYGIQGIGSIFVKRIEGSYSAVVGLPIEQTEALLRMLNIDTWGKRIDG